MNNKMGKKSSVAFNDHLVYNYSLFFFLLMFFLCITSILVTTLAVKRAEKLHAGLVREQIYDNTKTFLHDTVHNMIRKIEQIRAENWKRSKDLVDYIMETVQTQYRYNPKMIVSFARGLVLRQKNPELFTLAISNRNTGQTVFSTENTENIGDTSVYTRTAELGMYRFVCKVNMAGMDAVTKREAKDLLRSQIFDRDNYVWVNEVLDWNGGKNYAVRRIYSGSRDTAETLLSTDTADAVGELPYRTELEGIKQHGEVFFWYHFKQKDSDEILEKLTYAALYPVYNWIVAMGIYVRNIDYYVAAVNKSSRALDFQITVLSAILLLMAFGFVLLFFTVTWHRFLGLTGDVIRKESNIDPLTGTFNRRIGNDFFLREFNACREGARPPVLFSVDIDNFKSINDRLGHDTGDTVLRVVVERMYQTMRDTDILFRWGGEEFFIVYKDIKKANIMQLAERLNNQISATPVHVTVSVSGSETAYEEVDDGGTGSCLLPVTVSAGISWFGPSDITYNDALRRADVALYRAKAAGKNCCRIEPPPDSDVLTDI